MTMWRGIREFPSLNLQLCSAFPSFSSSFDSEHPHSFIFDLLLFARSSKKTCTLSEQQQTTKQVQQLVSDRGDKVIHYTVTLFNYAAYCILLDSVCLPLRNMTIVYSLSYLRAPTLYKGQPGVWVVNYVWYNWLLFMSSCGEFFW